MKSIFLLLQILVTAFVLESCKEKSSHSNLSNNENVFIEDSATKANRLMEEIKEEGRPYWVQAKKELFSIQNYIDLAEKGLVKKNDVIAEFNNTIGKVIGKSNSFDDVKKRVENSGDAYVEFVFNKACADIANRRAAEAAYKK